MVNQLKRFALIAFAGICGVAAVPNCPDNESRLTRKIAFIALDYHDASWRPEDYSQYYSNLNAQFFGAEESMQTFLDQHLNGEILLTGTDEAPNMLVDLGVLDTGLSTNVCSSTQLWDMVYASMTADQQSTITDVVMMVAPDIQTACPSHGFAKEQHGIDFIYVESLSSIAGAGRKTLRHEFLHGLGAGHAGKSDLEDSDASSFSERVYGDSTSIMGANSGLSEDFVLNFVDLYKIGQHTGIPVGAYVRNQANAVAIAEILDERNFDDVGQFGIMLEGVKHDVFRIYEGVSEPNSLAVSYRASDAEGGDRVYVRRVTDDDSFILDVLDPGESFHDTRAGILIDFVGVNAQGKAMVNTSRAGDVADAMCATYGFMPSISSAVGSSVEDGELLFDITLSHGNNPPACGYGLEMVVFIEVTGVNGVLRTHREIVSPDAVGSTDYRLGLSMSGLVIDSESTYRIVASRVVTERDGAPYEYLSSEVGPNALFE